MRGKKNRLVARSSAGLDFDKLIMRDRVILNFGVQLILIFEANGRLVYY